MDILTIIGLILAAAVIVAGLVFEGGDISIILQPTAALIVFGGTLGALFVHYSIRTLIDSIVLGLRTFLINKHDLSDIIPEITNFARKAQREGILALEKKIKDIEDPFFRKGIHLVVAGTGFNELKDILAIEIALNEERRMSAAKVFESAGRYAHFIGILGAVFGLIHVMDNLADPAIFADGVAMAVVAIIYGFASANLILLPIAGKIKLRTRENTIQKEMILEGLVAMLSGESPRLIEDRLDGFVSRSQWKEKERGLYASKK